MTNLRSTLFLIICITILAACSSTGNTHTFNPQPADSGRAVIYLYRPDVMANAIYSPELYVNGELKLSIKNGQTYRLTLSPGETTLLIEPDKHYSGITHLTLNLLPGKTYFIRTDTNLKIESSFDYEPYIRSFSLIQVEENPAMKQIAECCVTAARKAADTEETSTAVEGSDDGFSVNKTQNPFSH